MNNRSRRMILCSFCAAFLLCLSLPLTHLHAETKSMDTVTLDDSKENNPESKKGMVKLGGDQTTNKLTDKEEAPAHRKQFYIDENAVTYSEYERIMGEPPPGRYPGGESPVLSLTYRQAKDYCDRVGKRLPYDFEWEMAWGAGYRWRNPWSRHRANSYGRRGHDGYYPNHNDYGYNGTQGAWSYGSDDFSVYRDSHYSDDIYSKYGLRCAQ
jgi:formylglycine-generating enzyme required for sulfatase activity